MALKGLKGIIPKKHKEDKHAVDFEFEVVVQRAENLPSSCGKQLLTLLWREKTHKKGEYFGTSLKPVTGSDGHLVTRWSETLRLVAGVSHNPDGSDGFAPKLFEFKLQSLSPPLDGGGGGKASKAAKPETLAKATVDLSQFCSADGKRSLPTDAVLPLKPQGRVHLVVRTMAAPPGSSTAAADVDRSSPSSGATASLGSRIAGSLSRLSHSVTSGSRGTSNAGAAEPQPPPSPQRLSHSPAAAAAAVPAAAAGAVAAAPPAYVASATAAVPSSAGSSLPVKASLPTTASAAPIAQASPPISPNVPAFRPSPSQTASPVQGAAAAYSSAAKQPPLAAAALSATASGTTAAAVAPTSAVNGTHRTPATPTTSLHPSSLPVSVAAAAAVTPAMAENLISTASSAPPASPAVARHTAAPATAAPSTAARGSGWAASTTAPAAQVADRPAPDAGFSSAGVLDGQVESMSPSSSWQPAASLASITSSAATALASSASPGGGGGASTPTAKLKHKWLTAVKAKLKISKEAGGAAASPPPLSRTDSGTSSQPPLERDSHGSTYPESPALLQGLPSESGTEASSFVLQDSPAASTSSVVGTPARKDKPKANVSFSALPERHVSDAGGWQQQQHAPGAGSLSPPDVQQLQPPPPRRRSDPDGRPSDGATSATQTATSESALAVEFAVPPAPPLLVGQSPHSFGAAADDVASPDYGGSAPSTPSASSGPSMAQSTRVDSTSTVGSFLGGLSRLRSVQRIHEQVGSPGSATMAAATRLDFDAVSPNAASPAAAVAATAAVPPVLALSSSAQSPSSTGSTPESPRVVEASASSSASSSSSSAGSLYVAEPLTAMQYAPTPSMMAASVGLPLAAIAELAPTSSSSINNREDEHSGASGAEFGGAFGVVNTTAPAAALTNSSSSSSSIDREDEQSGSSAPDEGWAAGVVKSAAPAAVIAVAAIDREDERSGVYAPDGGRAVGISGMTAPTVAVAAVGEIEACEDFVVVEQLLRSGTDADAEAALLLLEAERDRWRDRALRAENESELLHDAAVKSDRERSSWQQVASALQATNDTLSTMVRKAEQAGSARTASEEEEEDELLHKYVEAKLRLAEQEQLIAELQRALARGVVV